MDGGIKGFCKRAYERRNNEDIKAANGIFDAPKPTETKQAPVTNAPMFAIPAVA